MRILDGPEVVLLGTSGTVELAREDGAVSVFGFPLVPPFVEAEVLVGLADILAFSVSAGAGFVRPAATAAAYSDSLPPAHERANQWPPPMPRISRFPTLQCRTFFPLLSSAITGANPEGIFGGGNTGKGFVGSGYIGCATPSSVSSAVITETEGTDIAEGTIESRFDSISGLVSRITGDDAAVPVYAAANDLVVNDRTESLTYLH